MNLEERRIEQDKLKIELEQLMVDFGYKIISWYIDSHGIVEYCVLETDKINIVLVVECNSFALSHRGALYDSIMIETKDEDTLFEKEITEEEGFCKNKIFNIIKTALIEINNTK